MTQNKMINYINSIAILIERNHLLTEDVSKLTEIQAFLVNLSDLFGYSLVQQQAAVPIQPTPMTPVAASPVVPTAPGAMKLTSNVAPVVDGCIAAQPQNIVQQVAQQRLEQLLKEEETKRAIQQAEFNKALEENKAQTTLTESLMQQMQAQPVAPAIQEVAAAPTPAPEKMTLAEFVAQNQAKEESAKAEESGVEAGQMTLDDFVKLQQAQQAAAQPPANIQAQFDAILAQQNVPPADAAPLA